jgi:hypothetical protein
MKPMRSLFSVALLVAMPLLGQTAADAATVTVIATGTVSSGMDGVSTSGQTMPALFGGNSNLAGLAFELTALYDTTVGNWSGTAISTATTTALTSLATNAISAITLKINGNIVALESLADSLLKTTTTTTNATGNSSIVSTLLGQTVTVDEGIKSSGYVQVTNLLASLFSDTSATATGGTGQFQFFEQSTATGAYLSLAYGQLTVTGVSVATETTTDPGPDPEVAPVPLPASIGLILAGLGAMPVVFRRRNSRLTPA